MKIQTDVTVSRYSPRVPLTAKGQKIMASMKKQYGAEKGERIFYATRNEKKIRGVERGKH